MRGISLRPDQAFKLLSGCRRGVLASVENASSHWLCTPSAVQRNADVGRFLVGLCCALLLATVVLGCSRADHPPRSVSGLLAEDPEFRTPESLDDLEASETVFRYLFDHNLSAFGTKAPAYFLRLRDEDPPPAFMARFAMHSPPVLPGSRFTLDSGLLFTVGGVRPVGADQLEVHCVCSEGPISGAGYVYRLRRTGITWAVVSSEVKWVS